MPYETLSAKKNELDRLLPFPAETAAELKKYAELELTYVGGIFDGSTLSRKETAAVLYEDKTVEGHSLTEHIQALNTAKAFEMISELAEKTSHQIDDGDVKNIHRVVMRNLDDKNAGYYRGMKLTFGFGSEALPDPLRVQRMMNDFGMWLFTAGTLHPAALAADAHLRLMAIQPFAAGNACTARMLMNLILMHHGYPPALFSRREKKEYWDVLEKAVFKNSRAEYDRLINRAVNRGLETCIRALTVQKIEEDDDEPYFLRIGQLAKESGERVSTLRYWTNLGLLETAGKTSADYMLYSSEVLPKIKRLKELKEQRYTLEEIRRKLQDG